MSILSIPLEFSGAAQLTLYTRYGDPRKNDFVNKWIKPWSIAKLFPWFPVKAIFIHKHFFDVLLSAFLYLEKTGLYKEITSFDDGFNIRTVQGSATVMSTHSWGCAIDLNAADNPIGSEGTWTDAFIEAMSSHQIFCGQSWVGRKEPMHFGLLNG